MTRAIYGPHPAGAFATLKRPNRPLRFAILLRLSTGLAIPGSAFGGPKPCFGYFRLTLPFCRTPLRGFDPGHDAKKERGLLGPALFFCGGVDVRLHSV